MNSNNQQGYGRGWDVLGGYGLLIAVFQSLFWGFVFLTKRRGPRLPRKIEIADLLLLGTATYKISRLVSKDSVTSVIRAPFTIYRGPSGSSEVKEDVRGTGVRKAVGELLTCPFCVGTWIASVMVYGLVLQPRVTRLVAAIFSVAAVSDALQYGFEALRKSTEASDSEDQSQAAGGGSPEYSH